MMDPDWFPLRGLFKLLKTISLTFQILLCQKSESSGMLDKRQFKTWIINYYTVLSRLKNIYKFLNEPTVLKTCETSLLVGEMIDREMF